MRFCKSLLILSLMFIVLPGRTAADEARTENAEPRKDRGPSERVERPKRRAVKMSPSIRQSPPRPDESGKMRRVAPPRGESPLQNVPALKDLYPPSTPRDRDTAPDAPSRQSDESPAR